MSSVDKTTQASAVSDSLANSQFGIVYINDISKEMTGLASSKESAARAATDKFAAFCFVPPVFGGLIEESSDSPASAPQVPWYANSIGLPPLHGVRTAVVKSTGTTEAAHG